MIFQAHGSLLRELQQGAVLSITIVNKNRNALFFGGHQIRPNKSLKMAPPFTDRFLADLERSWKLVTVSVDVRKEEVEAPAIHLDLDAIAARAGVDKATAELILAEAQKQRQEIRTGARIAKVAVAKVEQKPEPPKPGLDSEALAAVVSAQPDPSEEKFDVSDDIHGPEDFPSIIGDGGVAEGDDEEALAQPAIDAVTPVVSAEGDDEEALARPAVDLAPAAVTALKAEEVAKQRCANRKKRKKGK